MSSRSLEWRVGLFVLAALALLGVFIVTLGNVSLSKGFRLYVDFDFAGHLHAGAPVKIAGIQAGKIEEIRFMGGVVHPRTVGESTSALRRGSKKSTIPRCNRMPSSSSTRRAYWANSTWRSSLQPTPAPRLKMGR